MRAFYKLEGFYGGGGGGGGVEYKLNKNIGLNKKGVSSTSIENRLRGWNTS